MRPYIFACLLYVAFYGVPALPEISLPSLPGWPSIVAPVAADAVVYVHEKDDTAVPSGVRAGLNTLNRQGITATLLEDDTTNGAGDVPEQYKLPLEAARKAGLPCLVVMGGGKVLRVVANPATEAAIVEAVK